MMVAQARRNLLDGYRVLDFTQFVAGPTVTKLMAEMGAEIIKIERPGLGDDSRSWGPPFLEGRSLWNISVNRNKKSVELDLRQDDGRATVFEDQGQAIAAIKAAAGVGR